MNEAALKKYTPAIGIECHVQLNTKTKLFAAVNNDARQAQPNSLISHICVGMPGALPVLNEAAIKLAVKTAYLLNSEPQKFSKFDRKHYFYPDLPKGYQITQYEQPIIKGGSVSFRINGRSKNIRIDRVNLEEDAGKTLHPEGADYSLVDLNRAGTPLLEIVSEPDISSPAEAKAYAREVYLLMKYADISYGDLYHGNIRFDVNVSVSSDARKLGTRSEIKNLNSFKSVEATVEYEIKRQIDLLEKGQKVVQETRGWDEAKQKTTGQRDKEEAHDYRYMPEPDVPPVILDEKFVNPIRKDLPKLPDDWRKILDKLSISEKQAELLLESEVEYPELSVLLAVEKNLDDPELARFMANWFVNSVLPLVRDGNFKLNQEGNVVLMGGLYKLTKNGKLSSTAAKAIFSELSKNGSLPADLEQYASKKGFLQLSDSSEIEKIAEEVIANNPKASGDIKNGQLKAIGFMVGEVMKASRGKANPELAQKIIKKKLGLY